MIRRLFITASSLSLLLDVAVAAAWMRSYWFADAIGRSTLDAESLRYTCPMIVVESGRITVSRVRQDFDRESFALWAADLRDSPGSIKPGLWHEFGLRPGSYNFTKLWERFRVGVNRSHDINQPYLGSQWYWWGGEPRRRLIEAGRYSDTSVSVDFSCGYLVVLCLIVGIPAMKSIGRVIQRRGRKQLGRCSVCGYDLRASTDRCSECGAPISSIIAVGSPAPGGRQDWPQKSARAAKRPEYRRLLFRAFCALLWPSGYWEDDQMIRCLYIAGSVLSLFLFVASIGLWVRSDRGGEGWAFRPRRIEAPPAATGHFAGPDVEWQRRRWLFSSHGRLQWLQKDIPQPAGQRETDRPGYQSKSILVLVDGTTADGKRSRDWSLPGLEYAAAPVTGNANGLRIGGVSLVVAWEWITAATALLPTAAAIRFATRRRSIARRRANRCVNCGYDLRASSGRCPECGEPISAASKA
jgi:hypothetical protein